MKDKELEKKLLKETEESLKTMLNDGITDSNLDYIYKLVDIHKDLKEEESMNYGNYNGYGNYGNYGRRAGYDSYGRDSYGEYGNYSGNYGRRGYDTKYRGEDELERMHGEYGRYMESRSYGAGEETDKSFHYMVKALEDFIRVLEEEAQTQEQKMQLKQALQNAMR